MRSRQVEAKFVTDSSFSGTGKHGQQPNQISLAQSLWSITTMSGTKPKQSVGMKVRIDGRTKKFRTVDYNAHLNYLRLIDQRLLPYEFKVLTTFDFRETAEAIRNMTVRGAGAIGATAAYGLAQGVCQFTARDFRKFEEWVQTVYDTLKSTRPTAVDLVNAMDCVKAQMQTGRTLTERKTLAVRAAHAFADDQVNQCRAIGEHGAKLIRPGMRILTHCNAGWLAFVDFGSATAPMYVAHENGIKFHVFCDETRPRLQGAALTAWELFHQGISHEVIADNAAGHLMQRGEIDMVIVGSDRVLARTGDVANKIGTYTKAVLAARHGIPFYVAIPLSTIDWQLQSGMDIPIEERPQDEVLGAWGIDQKGRRVFIRTANPHSRARNPAFDVTPAELVTGLITPVGIFKPTDLWKHRRSLGIKNAAK